MPSLSLNVGLNNGRKLPFGGGAAPSGIVAATAGNLIIVFGFPVPLEYVKINNTRWVFIGDDGVTGILTWNDFAPLTWALDINEPLTVATNPSTNPLIIPTTGWTYTVGEGPAVTITAA